ncbi:hypothetical protein LSH36_35g01001 [Paralvinella palmiformis]|uniref:BRCT domain-containing protein n=1 Tax=Paralvinella palmiformis TaxID=53620 RepID=A0AAD9K9X0_9ANNE|nr:hypothetical protein LSH36_35g01001 [Paralvinella palmiformis]
MACTAGGTTKPKCRYWDKCFRKEKAHLQQYLHPNKDGADTGLHSDGKTGKKTLKLSGKNVLFLGTFSGTSNAQMVEQAKLYGCRVTEEMAEDVDIVVIGTGTTSEESEAKKLGLRIVTADYWQDLLSRSTSAPLTRSQSQTNSQPSTMASSVKLGEDVILKLKRQRTHNMSDDEDGETTPTKKPNTSGNDALSKCINNNYPVNMHLDGELFGGRGKFQETVSIVKNAGSLRWKELEYHVRYILSR